MDRCVCGSLSVGVVTDGFGNELYATVAGTYELAGRISRGMLPELNLTGLGADVGVIDPHLTRWRRIGSHIGDDDSGHALSPHSQTMGFCKILGLQVCGVAAVAHSEHMGKSRPQ